MNDKTIEFLVKKNCLKKRRECYCSFHETLIEIQEFLLSKIHAMWVVQCLYISVTVVQKMSGHSVLLLWPKKFRCAAAAASFFCSPKNEG